MDNFGADNSSLEPIPSSARKNGASPLFLSLVASAVLEDRSQSIVESFVRDNRFRKKNIPLNYAEDKERIRICLNNADKRIAELMRDGLELIEDVRVASDRHEVERRVAEADIKENLLSKIHAESVDSITKFQTTYEKWTEIKELKDPMMMNDELQLQKNRVEELLKQKDLIITECRKELLAADERYAKDIRKQIVDIQSLVHRADTEVEAMKSILKENLDLIQGTVEEERIILQNAANFNWNDVYAKRATNERIKVKQKKERLLANLTEIEQIELDYVETTRATRIKLDKDTQALAIELQKIKTNTTLNSEKLDYSFQVLKKREDENLMVKNAQKRRLAKLHETIFTLRNKLRDTKSNYYIETEKMAKMIEKLHHSVEHIHSKLECSKKAYDKRVRSIWNMNRDECFEIIQSISAIDKILVEQHLNRKWVNNLSIISEVLLQYDPLCTPKLPSTARTKRSLTGGKDEPSDDFPMLESLLKQTRFLNDKKLETTLQEQQLDSCGLTLICLDNVLNALGIHSIDGIRGLQSTQQEAHKVTYDEESTSSAEASQAEKEDTELGNRALTTSRDLLALKMFYQDDDETVHSVGEQKLDTKPTLTDTRKFWDSFKNIFLPTQIKMWNTMEESLSKYLQVLRERQTLDEECSFLRKQNQELQHIMQKMLIKPMGDDY
ncbi:dynein regulatory complex protein 1 homolog isoform X1 [Anopheles albimanus]|uniref:dynein regulatory complex protein 1 homolog isoform X1 n=2 Tax=Anopheles albimanus TaxID=7167 RepID=UPI0016413910|nr:dynein regulatory complex protein 1 homolog isoform X1 [Anopheles albimanus]